MKKLAFEAAGNFEMPKLQMVGLEKGENVMFDTPITVYTPQNGMLLEQGNLRAAMSTEIQVLSNGSSVG